MEEINVKKYYTDKLIEENIKKLTVEVLSKEVGLSRYENFYRARDFEDKDLHIWYIEKEGAILATMMLKILDNNIGRIENVCCNAQYRGKGLAEKLLDSIIEFARAISLNSLQLRTFETLERAIHFYEKNGFVEMIQLRDEQEKARCYELIIEEDNEVQLCI